MTAPELTGVYLFVRDMDATVAFYERLGLTITRAGDHFASANQESGLAVSFGSAELTRGYDPNWREPTGPGTNTLNFTLASREAVDAMYTDLVAAGYAPHLAPVDAFWGSRFAIVDDPDGNVVGLHSPVDPDRGSPPRSSESEAWRRGHPLQFVRTDARTALVTEPRRVELSSDHDAVEALDAVRSDSVPRVMERDGEAIAAIISVEDLQKMLSVGPSDAAIARALAVGGAWRDLGGEALADKITRWRHASPEAPPVEL